MLNTKVYVKRYNNILFNRNLSFEERLARTWAIVHYLWQFGFIMDTDEKTGKVVAKLSGTDPFALLVENNGKVPGIY